MVHHRNSHIVVTKGSILETHTMSKKKNQLVKTIKPLEELLICSKTQPNYPNKNGALLEGIPLDEIVVPKEKTTTPRFRLLWQEKEAIPEPRQTRQHEPSESSRRELDLREEDNVPPFLFGVPTNIIGSAMEEDSSQISCEVVSKASSRSLTPHPSFDGLNKNMTMTAKDFHYLYQASRKLEEHDWPSDEEGSPLAEGCEWFEGFLPATSQLVYKKGIACIILNDLDETTSLISP